MGRLGLMAPRIPWGVITRERDDLNSADLDLSKEDAQSSRQAFSLRGPSQSGINESVLDLSTTNGYWNQNPKRCIKIG